MIHVSVQRTQLGFNIEMLNDSLYSQAFSANKLGKVMYGIYAPI